MVKYIQPPKKMTEEQAEEFVFRLETHFQAYVKERLSRIHGVWYYHPADIMSTGVPDCVLCIKSYFIAVELKVGKNTTSALQDSTIAKIMKAGGKAGVAYNWGEFKDIVNDAIYELGQAPIEWGLNDGTGGEKLRGVNTGVCKPKKAKG